MRVDVQSKSTCAGVVVGLPRDPKPGKILSTDPTLCNVTLSLGAQSADSIGWRQAAGFGSIYLPGGNQRLLSWKSKSPQPRPLINASDRALLAECNCPVCRPIELLQYRVRRLNGNFTQRSLHNLWVLRREIDSLIVAQEGHRDIEFLSPRLSAPWLAAISQSRQGLRIHSH